MLTSKRLWPTSLLRNVKNAGAAGALSQNQVRRPKICNLRRADRPRRRSTKDFKPAEADCPEDILQLLKKVDLRKYMSPVEDQSQCNSCSANAVAAYEYINRTYCHKTGDKPGDISRLFIYYVGRKKDLMSFDGRPTAVPKDEGM